MNYNFYKSIISAFAWSISGKIGYIAVGFIANIILARTLGPEPLGAVGIVIFFITISKVIVESGFSGALIRKDDISNKDYSTVLIFNVFVSLLLIVLIYFLAKPISIFYQSPIIEKLLIVSSIVLFIDAFRIVQDTKLIKNLKFKKKSLYEFISIFISSIAGIILVFNGAGVWSIIIMNILSVFILTSMLWVMESKIKINEFSIKSFKKLYKFGLNTTLSLLLTTFYDNIYQLIIGKYFSIRQTGLYYNAKRLQEIPVGLIQSSTMGVAYASLSKIKNDEQEFKKLYLKIRIPFTVIIGFITMFIFYYSKDLILLFYGVDWVESTYFIKFLIISSFFYMQEMFNRIIFKVFDKTHKILKLELIKKTIQTITIIVGIIYLNLNILLWGFLFTSIISYFINFIELNKLSKDFFKNDILLTFKVLLSCITCIFVCFLFEYYFNVKSILLMPVMILIYIYFINFLKILNVRKDFKKIFLLLNEKNN